MTDTDRASRPRLAHIMLDLETLGTRPGSVITQIGAYGFGRGSAGLQARFHRNLSIEDQLAAGLAIDESTLRWWLDQPNSPLGPVGGGLPLARALPELADFISTFCLRFGEPGQAFSRENLRIWSFGASFDVPLLESAAKAVGATLPWNHYRSSRCLRTFFALFPRERVEFAGEAHKAGDDAERQALELIATAAAHNIDLDAI